MGATYTRQEASNITDGSVIEASHLNNEFNQLLAAFASSTGHSHDGTSAEGGYVPLIADSDANNKISVDTSSNRFGVFVEVASNPVEQVRFQDGAIVPVTDNDIDLGTSALEFKNAYFDGTITTDGLALPTTTITDILDEDNMASDSATALATQQSIKAYVDSQVTAQDLDFQADSGGALSIDLDSESLTFTGGTGIDTSGSGNAVTFAIDSTVATLTGTQTLTNKTIDTANNTITVVEADISDLGSYITASSTDTLTNKSISLTTNTLTGTTAEFNTALSDGSFTTLAGTETLTNKTLTTPTLTSPVLNTSVSGTAFLDDDTFATASATTLASSESIKAYVDAQVETANELSELTDVNLTSPATGALLFYNTVTSEWADAVVSGDFTISSGGVGAIASGVIVDADINSSAAIDATKIHDGTVSNTEFGYLNGVTSAIQTQIDAKQASDAQLDDIAGLTPTDGNFIVGDGTNFVTESGGTARTSLGLGTIATQDANNVNIDGGNIDGTAIGASVRSTAQFSTLQVQSTSTLEGAVTLNDDLDMGDSNKIKLGADDDLEIYHDGANSRINDAGTGSLKLQSANTDRIIIDSNVTIQGLVYPSSDGTSGQTIQTDGAGNLTFATPSAGASQGFAIAMAVAL